MGRSNHTLVSLVVLLPLIALPAGGAAAEVCAPVWSGSYDDPEDDAYHWYLVTPNLANETYDEIAWRVNTTTEAVLLVELVYRGPNEGAPPPVMIWRTRHDMGPLPAGVHEGDLRNQTSHGLLYSVGLRLVDHARTHYEHVGADFAVTLSKCATSANGGATP